MSRTLHPHPTLVTFFVARFLVQDVGVLACWSRHDFNPLSIDDLESVVTGIGRCRGDR